MLVGGEYDVSTGVRAFVGDWPDVREKKEFGLAAFCVDHAPFLLCEQEAVILAGLSAMERDNAARIYQAEPYIHGGKEYPQWCRVPCRTRLELQTVEGLIRSAYEAAR